MACPVCSNGATERVLRRERLPVMQNVTYPTRELALASTCAPFELGACPRCGFMFNSVFESALMRYDPAYDNHVESTAFHRYYEVLSRMLIDRFDLAGGGTVYDVGCGRGTFLKTLCAVAPKVRGFGIDPACDPGESENVTLVRSPFSRSVIKSDGKLIVLRHVLEHIERPLEFLAELREVAGTIPLFVEVPDAGWIFDNGAFWDFCYEHCNYFTMSALKFALEAAGLSVEEQQRSFGGQYQWAICRGRATGTAAASAGGGVIDIARRYAASEAALLGSAAAQVQQAAERGSCAIWGMATKGVVFSNLVAAPLIAGGVDSNERKQGRFAPGSGLAIHPPGWLTSLRQPVTAIVMNPNYLEEIRGQTRAMGLDADLRTF